MTPAQSPVETVRTLPRDPGPLRLYVGAVRYLTGRAAVSLATASLRLASWAVREAETARNRAVESGHPSTRPRLSVVADGIAQGRADLQLTHRKDTP